ncbi:MAG: hypothetical protein LBV12_08200 [Puniceicoccales bacterium]|jgi:hypothetical protein|nr:hypothetical protein [Puniceicoccales bacterium]
MDTDNEHDALDFRLDELLADASVCPTEGFADKVMMAVNANDECDKVLDERLAAQVVMAKPERTERLHEGVLASIRHRKWFAWSGSAMAALIAGALAIPAFIVGHDSEINPEVLVVQAMGRDPALAAMLRTDTGNITEQDVINALSGLNDNTLAWLEVLTSNES